MSVPPAMLDQGVWGGEQVVLTVEDERAVLRLGCAEGELPAPIALDRHGRFSITGQFSAGQGGPSTPKDRVVKAHYMGALDGERLTLTVRHGGSSETYQLVKGLQSKVIRCL